MSNFTPVKAHSITGPHSHRVVASSPFSSPVSSQGKPTTIFGRVVTPSNSVNQLSKLAAGTSLGPTVALGGAWKDLQIQKERQEREKEELLGRTRRAEVAYERISMQNEDLVSATVRLEYELSKVRCYDLMLENKLDKIALESESLRTMHVRSVEELEVSKSLNKEQAARLQAMEGVLSKTSSSKSTLDVALIDKDGEIERLSRELAKQQAVNRKQQALLVDEKKKSALYMKLKDDKDEHIQILVKEKNRLHDTLQDMAKRHTKTARSLGFVNKAEAVAPAPYDTPVHATPIDLDDVLRASHNDDETDQADADAVKPTQLNFESGGGRVGAEDGGRTGSVDDIMGSVGFSNASSRDRLLLNTIKKLSRDLKRKDDEYTKRERDFDEMKKKNDDMSRRIRNSVRPATSRVSSSGGASSRGGRENNSTPSPC
jgi:hypothetical protein